LVTQGNLSEELTFYAVNQYIPSPDQVAGIIQLYEDTVNAALDDPHVFGDESNAYVTGQTLLAFGQEIAARFGDNIFDPASLSFTVEQVVTHFPQVEPQVPVSQMDQPKR
jgi:hypothetical protein